MSLPVAIILVVLAIAAIAALLAGFYIRKGTSPACRRCAYDLSALQPANCPECNADLTRDGSIRLGQRRTRLAWAGTGVLALCLIAGAYMLIQSPGFDRMKPVWLLRVEMAVVNDTGDERIIAELRRRITTPGITPGDHRAIADITLDAIEAGTSGPSMYDLLVDATRSGLLPAERVDPIISELIALWSVDTTTDRQFPHGTEMHKNVLAELIQSHATEFETLRPMLDEGMRLAKLPIAQQDQNRHSQSAEILLSWWGSPGAPSVATDEYFAQLFRDAPIAALQTRHVIASDTGFVPYNLNLALPPLIASESDFLTFAQKTESLRVIQNGVTLFEMPASSGGSSQGMRSRHAFESSRSSMAIPIKGIQPGMAELLLTIRCVITRDERNNANRVDFNDRFDPAKTPSLVDRTITLRAEFEVVPPGADPIEMLIPGEGDTPTERALLKRMVFSPVYYDTSKAWGSQGPWSFSLGMAEVRHDLRAQIELYAPEIDLAFRVVAEQDDTTWEIGTVQARNLLQRSGRTVHQVQAGLVPLRKTESGEYVWSQPTPDLNRPVRIRLIPEPDLARKTIDVTAMYGGELDLGWFDITPTDGPFRAQQDATDSLRPAPILSE